MERFTPDTKDELILAIRESPEDRLANGRGNINTWNLRNISDLSFLFADNITFNEDISKWDVSHVTNMSSMFYNAQRFNQNISRWDVSHVTNMSAMFKHATSFNQNLSRWDVSSVKDMSAIFENATSFNQSLKEWDVPQLEFFGASFSKITELFDITSTLIVLEVKDCKLTSLRVPKYNDIDVLDCTGNPLDIPTIKRLIAFYKQHVYDGRYEFEDALYYFIGRLDEKKIALAVSTKKGLPYHVGLAEVASYLGGKMSKKSKRYTTTKYKVKQNKTFRY
jgi:surface protein